MNSELERLQKLAQEIEVAVPTLPPPPMSSVEALAEPPAPEPPAAPVQTPAPVTPIKTKKQVKTETEPAPLPFRKPNYFRGALDRLVSTGERIKVYKVDDMGKTSFVKSYTFRELEQTNDIEEFVQKYLVPKYGPGDYGVSLSNSKGEETRQVIYNVFDPDKPPVPQPPVSDTVTAKTVDKLLDRISELEKRPPPKEPTVSDKLADLKAMKDMFGSQPDPMAIFMMMDRMKPDPSNTEIAALKEMVKELREKADRPQVLPPMQLPPMEPAFNPVDMMKMVAEMQKPQLTVQDMIALLERKQEPPKQSFGVTELMSTITTLAPLLKSLLGIDQIGTLAQQLQSMQQQQNASKGLRESLDDMRLLFAVVNEMSPRDTGNFWSAAENIFGGIRELMKDIRSDEKKKAGGSEDAESDAEVEEEEVQLTFPAGIDKWAEKLKAAKDDAERVEQTLKLIQWLARKPDWMKAAKKLIEAAKENSTESRKGMIEFLDSMLGGMVQNELLGDDDKKMIVRAFETHLDKVITLITAPKK